MELNYFNTSGIILDKYTNLFILKKINDFNTNGFISAKHGNILKVIHKCSKKEGYQVTYIDNTNNEPIGDLFRFNLIDCIKEVYNM